MWEGCRQGNTHALGVYFAIIKATITPFQETLRLRCAKELCFSNSPHMLCVRVERLYFELLTILCQMNALQLFQHQFCFIFSGSYSNAYVVYLFSWEWFKYQLWHKHTCQVVSIKNVSHWNIEH